MKNTWNKNPEKIEQATPEELQKIENKRHYREVIRIVAGQIFERRSLNTSTEEPLQNPA